MACVVLQNMTIEDEQNLNLERSFHMKDNITFRNGLSFEDYAKSTTQIENHDSHYNLQNDFIKHLWQLKGKNEL
jgi:hypothetical protein